MVSETTNDRFALAAEYLIRAIEADVSGETDAELRKFMGRELFVKVRAFSRMNKAFAVPSVILSFSVILWPSLVIIDGFFRLAATQVAVVQTSLTALAALCIAAHVQYKRKQTEAETMLRLIAFSGQPVSELVLLVNSGMSIDTGFVPRLPDANQSEDGS